MKPARSAQAFVRYSMLTKEQPSNNGMGIEEFRIRDVAKTDPIELGGTSTAGCIDGNQNWPCQAYTNRAN
jgi:hypothetical protein